MSPFARPFDQMQEGELAWWKANLAPDQLPRLFAIYGYRYLPYFFREFDHLGAVVDFGSGPVSAAFLGQNMTSLACVDPLLERYQEADLVYRPHHIAYWPPTKLATGETDTALILNTLDHTPDPQPILEEARRLIKPSGQVLIWNHVDYGPDELHTCLSYELIHGMVLTSGLKLLREIRHSDDYGPDCYLAVATRTANP